MLKKTTTILLAFLVLLPAGIASSNEVIAGFESTSLILWIADPETTNEGFWGNTDTQESEKDDSDLSFEERMLGMLVPPSGFIEDAMIRQQFALGTSGIDIQMQEMNRSATAWASEFQLKRSISINTFEMPEFRGTLGFAPENFGQMNKLPDISGVFETMHESMARDYASIAGSINFADIMARNQAQGQSMAAAAGMGNFQSQLATIQSLSAHRAYGHDAGIVAESDMLRARHGENFSSISQIANMQNYEIYRDHNAAARENFGTGLLGGIMDGISPIDFAYMSREDLVSLTQGVAGYLLDDPEIGGQLSPGHPFRVAFSIYAGRTERPEVDHLARVTDPDNHWWAIARHGLKNDPAIQAYIDENTVTTNWPYPDVCVCPHECYVCWQERDRQENAHLYNRNTETLGLTCGCTIHGACNGHGGPEMFPRRVEGTWNDVEWLPKTPGYNWAQPGGAPTAEELTRMGNELREFNERFGYDTTWTPGWYESNFWDAGASPSYTDVEILWIRREYEAWRVSADNPHRQPGRYDN